MALTIFAIVVTTVYSAFATGLKLRKRSRVHMQTLQQARQLISTLKDDLANLSPHGPQLKAQDSNLTLLRCPRRHILEPENAGRQLLVRYYWDEALDGSRVYTRLEIPLSEAANDSMTLENIFTFFENPENSRGFSPLESPDLPVGLDVATVMADQAQIRWWTRFPGLADLQAVLAENEAAATDSTNVVTLRVGIASTSTTTRRTEGTPENERDQKFRFETALPIPALMVSSQSATVDEN